MIRPALRLAEDHEALYFIADSHALTTVSDGATLKRLTYEAAATLLALGLDPERARLYRQSHVPEVFELAWVLTCSTPKGLLNRAHAYKAAVQANRASGRATDEGVTAGLFNYPVLMAADVLLVGADVIPVGSDQIQHIEIAREVASRFNSAYGPVLKLPGALVQADVSTVPGRDGRKMSKSSGNEIPIFASPRELRSLIMKIVTDSRRPEEPKDAASCNVFALYRHFATPEAVHTMSERYRSGGVGYSEAKSQLFEALEETFSQARRRYEGLMANPPALDAILADGARRARALARPTMDAVRKALGTA